VVLDDRDGLSPDEAAIMALDQNPRLRAVRAERGIARAELLTAGILPNPRLDSSLDFPVSGPEATVLGYGVGLSWNVTPLVSRGARLSAGEENLASVDLDVAWQEWQVAQAARLHAVRSIYLERRIALAGKVEGTWQQRLDGLRRAQAARAATALDVVNAERSLAEVQVGRLGLQEQLVAERIFLNQAMGLDARAEPVLDSSWSPSETAPSADSLLRSLPLRRLDLVALRHAQRSHDQALRAAVLARFPAVTIGVRIGREVDQSGFAGLTLSFEIPFFDRNQGNVARERTQHVRLEAEYDARLLEARAEVLRVTKEVTLVGQQIAVSTGAAEAASRLAELVPTAATSGGLSAFVAADIQARAYAARLRTLEIQQTLAELQVALVISSGVD
jgi:outer membrane protein, heavy metal efflux system